MKKLPEPISNYVNRFISQYDSLNIDDKNLDIIIDLIVNKKVQLNNLLMSGLGAATLILRLGSVINLSKKLEEGSDEEDAILIKQIVDNLREILPSDTNWRIIWEISCDRDSNWASCIEKEKGGQSLMEKFVTFRNRYVHEIITLRPKDAKKVFNGIRVLNRVCLEVSPLFTGSKFEEINGEFNFIEKGEGLLSKSKKINLHPFIQKGTKDGLPYVFQGLYDNKKTAELISTYYGDVQEQDVSKHYDSLFNPMLKSLKGGAGKIFYHNDTLDYYLECFVGRENESNKILDWIENSDQEENILPIFSQAGMGKGALISNIINELSDSSHNIPVLYHFCNSGMANNLHAILYHLILQGKKSQIWNLDDDEISQKIKRLPVKYHDLISLFQELLDNNFKITRSNTSGNLVIIIDGLDEASVAFPDLHIEDYFLKYDENGNSIGEWKSELNIKWIFSYREGLYKFPETINTYVLDKVQPLEGLSEDSVTEALDVFKPSKDFIKTVIDRGEIIK